MDKFWKWIESAAYFAFYQVLHLKMKQETFGKWVQFVKFGIVGLSNTVISYAVYALLVTLHIHYLAASTAGFIISVINAFYWSNGYIFKEDETSGPRVLWKTFLKTFTAYAGTGLVLNNLLLVLWIKGLGIHEMLGPIINLLITIPLNFLINKYWAYKGKRK